MKKKLPTPIKDNNPFIKRMCDSHRKPFKPMPLNLNSETSFRYFSSQITFHREPKITYLYIFRSETNDISYTLA